MKIFIDEVLHWMAYRVRSDCNFLFLTILQLADDFYQALFIIVFDTTQYWVFPIALKILIMSKVLE